MKKNILTIIIMAIALINTVLLAVLIFVIVPTSNKTTQLVAKVASIIDLELEAPEVGAAEVAVSDINTYEITDKLTINLKKTDETIHYALLNVSLSINSKHKDTATLEPKIELNENEIKEIVTEEFGKYSIDDVIDNKNTIKEQVLIRIQEHFRSDFIINVSFGNIILQ
ncbi:MAG: putative rane protein [Herbinix sp.]|nr:putative rane protein [Herbinix sp.]